MKFAASVRAISAVVLVASAGLAQEAQPGQPPQPGMQPRGGYDSTYRRHFGFYIRPDLGFGYMASNEATQTFSGLAGHFGIAVGGALRENSILAVHVFDSVVRDPDVSSGGSLSSTEFILWGIGPQYTHYFMAPPSTPQQIAVD